MTGKDGKSEEELIEYRRTMFFDYVGLGLLLLMPAWMPLVMWWRGLFHNPWAIAGGIMTYVGGMWQEYWCFFKTPQSVSLGTSSIAFKYFSRKRSPRMWPLAKVTAELLPRSSWKPPSRKTLALTNMETNETVFVDVEKLTTPIWNVVHDLEDRGVQVTLLTKPPGHDPREGDDPGESTSFLT